MTAARDHFDLIVIGSGAAGAACWLRAREMGKSVAVFEQGTLGGECANFACMPTKALLHAAEVMDTVRGAGRFGISTGPVSFDYAAVKAWKDEVVGQTGAALGEKPYLDAGVTLVRERARFVSPGEIEAGGRRYTADKFLIATGAGPAIPPVEGLSEAGYLTFRDAIDLEAVPRSLLILGGGPVGCEFAQLFSSFGVQVHLADLMPRLVGNEDPEVGDALAQVFRARGVNLLLESNVEKVQREADGKRISLQIEGRSESLLVDEVLIASGKRPNTDLDLEAAGISYDRSGIKVDDHLRTSNANVFAAGDVVGPYQLTHAASYQGTIACQNMFGGQKQAVDYSAMPRCVFTLPEVAAVGLTEAQARQRFVEVRTGLADLIDNDRGLTTDQRSGFVKVIADREGRLLGGVMVGARAGEVMHELALAISLGANAAHIASLIHAFPTFSESLSAACAAV